MTELDPAILADAIRETGIALRPGDVLAVRLPSNVNRAEVDGANRLGRAIEADAGVRVVFVPGEEFSHSTVNVTVNWSGDPEEFGKQIYERFKSEIWDHVREEEKRWRLRNGSPKLDYV